MISAISYHILYIILNVVVVPSLLDWLYNTEYYQSAKQRSNHVKKKKAVIEGTGHDVAVVTERIINILTAFGISVVGAVIVHETYEDVLKKKSSIIYPCSYFFSWYFIHDFYFMFKRVKASNIKYTDLPNRVVMYEMLTSQLSFVLHHILLIIFGLTIIHYSVRKGLGDFIIGCLYLMEISNPFLCVHFILKAVSDVINVICANHVILL
jgi:hypothetical protein